MINLLLVDDEHYTREGIIENFPLQELGVSKVMQAEDGSAALKIAENFKPDILLTDVRMPVLDGIELAFNIREMYPECKIIFMSGYSDKEYLKSAIKLKAIEYVEKPITQDELISAIQKAVSECIQDRNKKQLDQKNETFITNELALDLAINTLNLQHIEDSIRLCSLEELYESEFLTLLVKIVPKNVIINKPVNTLKTEIQQIIENEIPHHKFKALFAFKNDNNVIIHLYCPKNTNNILSLKNIETFCSSTIHKLKDTLNIIFSAGNKVNHYTDVYLSYQAAVLAMEKGFFSGFGNIVFSSQSNNLFYDFDNNLIYKFSQSLKDKQKHNSISIIKSLSSDLRIYQNTLVSNAKNFFYKLSLELFKIAEEHHINILENNNKEDFLWESIYQADTLDELTRFIINKIEVFFENINHEGTNNIVWLIKKYIEQNYAKKDLSIKEISEHAFLNTSYICVLFKNETGTTINQYLTEYRINKAKELLSARNNSLTDVASMVGYADVNYFSKIFKKLTNSSPSKYKEHHIL